MTAKDHNETLVGIHFAAGLFFSFGILASPWIIAQNFRHREQLPLVIIIFGTVLTLAVLMLTTAIAMYRRKPIGRTLALWAAGFLMILFWPAGVYSWWFMHSDGAKEMYGVEND